MVFLGLFGAWSFQVSIYPYFLTHLFASISFPNRSRSLLCCFQRLETPTKMSAHRTMTPLPLPPTFPNASRTCVRSISPNVASFHVPLKPSASLRISPCNICDAFYPTLDVRLISSFCEQQLVLTNDNANDQKRSLEA